MGDAFAVGGTVTIKVGRIHRARMTIARCIFKPCTTFSSLDFKFACRIYYTLSLFTFLKALLGLWVEFASFLCVFVGLGAFRYVFVFVFVIVFMVCLCWV